MKDNWGLIETFRRRHILDFDERDTAEVKKLFEAFLGALRIASGKKKGTQSPVAVAKTLHLLAPGFFPLWDDKIARAYGCYYAGDPVGAYLRFCLINQVLAKNVQKIEESPKTLLKVIDEYNYAKHTKGWI